jgi:hypothetical protein
MVFEVLVGHPLFEIGTEYPHIIRRRATAKIINPNLRRDGYYRIYLTGREYMVHRLIGDQFIPNPHNLPQIDHINHDRGDNRIENLRWSTQETNMRNLSYKRDIEYEYVDELPENAIGIISYKHHQLIPGYFYCNNHYYFYNGVKYRILHVVVKDGKYSMVHMRSTEHKNIGLCPEHFKRENNLQD